MTELVAMLNQVPLREEQRVLALTFMHGSRRRLEARLGAVLRRRVVYECSTIDSFAWRIIRRWRSFVERIGRTVPGETEYEAVCDLAGALLEYPPVVRWVGASCPIVLVDEAQDLMPERLRIIRALATQVDLLVAGDEFQCLDERLRPNPFLDWIATVTRVEALAEPRRTNASDLLAAAAAIRRGSGPPEGKHFRITVTPTVPFAGNYVSNQIAWYRRGGTLAVISPSAGTFATEVVRWVRETKSKRGSGPYPIEWERTDQETLADLMARLDIRGQVEIGAASVAIAALQHRYLIAQVRGWLDMQRRVLGRHEVEGREIEAAVERALALMRRVRRADAGGLSALTVHGAKNREFDGVVVLWPYAVLGDGEQKRRLLYTAVTRAKRWCHVLVQGRDLRAQAPFG